MHADMMLHSTLPTEEIGPEYNPDDPKYAGEKRERSVVIEEIGMRDDQPWTKVYNTVNAMMYPDNHPYQRDVIGTRQIIGTIPRASIVDYYQTWYAPSTMTTLVVGDFDFETLKGQIQQYFDFTKRKGTFQASPKLLNAEDTPALSPKKEHYALLQSDYQTAFFITGYHGPDPKNLKETIAMDVASYVLGEGRSSRFTQELLEKPAKPIFNGLSCGQSSFKLGNVFMIQGNFQVDATNGSPDAPLKQVQAEIEKFLTSHPITEEECRRAVKKLKVDFAETSETASGIAETLGECLTVVEDLKAYTHYLEELSALDVDTVRAVARKYLAPELAYTAVMVPEQDAKTR
jgi:zinc protease